MGKHLFVSVLGAVLMVMGIFVYTVVRDEFLGRKEETGDEKAKAEP